ncbi:MAG TPA: GNAT family N-acetyltransferase, partial [Dokdonella sp.]|nr:GNAT family N-acetyltransferase [Dokdonella sp.]
MITSGFSVEPATWEVDLDELRALRTAVFVVEQGVPEDEEWDEHDARSHHVIARDSSGRAIGTGRLTPQRMIGRMAVLPEWRGRGVGAALLRALLERARELRLPEVELHAQVHAIPFYERAGFTAFGDEYDECGIPHRSMRMHLDTPAGREPTPADDAGGTGETWLTATREEARAAILAVIGSARRELAVMSRDLDAELFEHADVLEALRQLAVGTPNSSASR